MSQIWHYFLFPISPLFAISITSMALIFLECFESLEKLPHLKLGLALSGVAIALVGSLEIALSPEILDPRMIPTLGNWYGEFLRYYRMDRFTAFLTIGICLFTLLSLIPFSFQFSESDQLGISLTLPLFVAAGMMVLVSSQHLLITFLGLELLSLPTYVMVGLSRTKIESCEASLKYFLFGSFATVLFILGCALLFGSAKSLSYDGIAAAVEGMKVGANQAPMFFAGVALVMIALLFKSGIFPFHFWVPDAYSGAASSVTGFMGSAIKFTAFAVTLQFFWIVLGPLQSMWKPIFTILAVATAFVGNIAAIQQDDLKRLFAYSSIAHAGYLLLGLTSIGSVGAVYYYLITYGITYVGLFTVVVLLEKYSHSTSIYQLSGLGFTHPFIGICLSFFVLSMAGIPPFTGFIAKYFLFYQAFQAGNHLAVILTLVSTMIGMYIYLKCIVFLYMKENRVPFIAPRRSGLMALSMTLSVLLLVYFGICPIF